MRCSDCGAWLLASSLAAPLASLGVFVLEMPMASALIDAVLVFGLPFSHFITPQTMNVDRNPISYPAGIAFV